MASSYEDCLRSWISYCANISRQLSSIRPPSDYVSEITHTTDNSRQIQPHRIAHYLIIDARVQRKDTMVSTIAEKNHCVEISKHFRQSVSNLFILNNLPSLDSPQRAVVHLFSTEGRNGPPSLGSESLRTNSLSGKKPKFRTRKQALHLPRR